jgi:hypothetical protein
MPPVVRCETRTAFIRLGRLDQAEHVTASAVDVLQRVASPAEPSPETLSLYGAMHLVQAVISGQESDRSRVHAHLAEAKRIGEQLGSATTSRPNSVHQRAAARCRGCHRARRRRRSARRCPRHRRIGSLIRTPGPAACRRGPRPWSASAHRRGHQGTARLRMPRPGTFGLTTWPTARSGTSSTSSDGEHRPTWSNSHVEAEQCRSAESPVGGDVLGEPSLITVAAATPRPHVSHDDPGSRLLSPRRDPRPDRGVHRW